MYQFVIVRLVILERVFGDFRTGILEPEHQFRRFHRLVYVVVLVQSVVYLLPEAFFVDCALPVDPVYVPVVKVALCAFDLLVLVRNERVVDASSK